MLAARNRWFCLPRGAGPLVRALVIVSLLMSGPAPVAMPALAAEPRGLELGQEPPAEEPEPAPTAEGAPLDGAAEAGPAPEAAPVAEEPPTSTGSGQAAELPAQTDAPAAAPPAQADGSAATPRSVTAPTVTQTRSYVVKAGDTLYSIARRHGVGVDALVAANKLASADAIREGQKLLLPLVAAASSEQPTPLPPAPADGPGAKHSEIPITLFPTAPPALQPTPTGSPSISVTTARLPKLVWPIDRKPPRIEVTQSFHPAHRALDIGAPENTAIKAAAGGVVRLLEKTETPYGWVLVIDHGNDISTWYAHLSAFAVKKGDRVEAGQKIGEVGNTGRSTGPHLHFELRIKNTPINPRLALP